MIIFISFDSIFLPRYSGVRPTISPAMNTARRAKISIPISPVPTPPKTISPMAMFSMAMPPPSGVRLSWELLTAPHEASVVTLVNSAEPAGSEAHLFAFHVAAGLR